MSDALGVAVMVLIGAQLAPQAPINRELGLRAGGLSAAFVSFAVGAVLVVALCLLAGRLGDVWGVWGVPPGDAAGGLLGGAFVLVALFCVGAIGAGGVAAGTVAGQLIASLGLDATGALGLPTKPLTVWLLAGALAVLAGTWLVLPHEGRRRRAAAGGGREPRGEMLARLAPAVAIVLAGTFLGLQHPLNAQLATSVGDLPASVVNFAVGTVALGAVLLASGQAPRLAAVRRAPPYLLSGGVYGAINATVALALVDQIGAGALAAATVTGQMTASLLLDRAGLLGLEPHPVTARRIAGAVLLVAGTILVAV